MFRGFKGRFNLVFNIYNIVAHAEHVEGGVVYFHMEFFNNFD